MSPQLAWLINDILFWLAVTVVGMDAYFLFFHAGIPNIRTAPAIRRHLIARITQDYQERGCPQAYTIVDLGSGNGLFTRELAKALPKAQVVGVEIARQSVWWANLMKRRAGLDNLQYRCMSFFEYNFAQADVVYMFLLPAYTHKLGEMLREQARPGTLIISNKFKLGPQWAALQSEQVRSIYLHQGKFFIYKV